MSELDSKDGDGCLWYFAYGANMSSAVFTTRRKIQPLRAEVASIESHVLCFDVMGMPYSDPANGGIRTRNKVDDNAEEPPVTGVAYLVSQPDLARLIASEGGGVAYIVVQLSAKLQQQSCPIRVWTLIARRALITKERLPSVRYMRLLIQGAEERSLPEPYQKKLKDTPTFDPRHSIRYKIGKWTFELVWVRISLWIQRGIVIFKDQQGNVPPWFLFGFDLLLWIMWKYHDYVHSFFWGRGDGL